MYSSYYKPNNRNIQSKSTENHNLKKSSAQYLFLNMVRMFSIIYLILTIFYIPVYLGISSINSQQIQTEFTYSERLFLKGTIFAIKKYERCFQSEIQFKKIKDVADQKGFLLTNDGKYCFINKVNFPFFVSTVEEFHTFYFSYFLVFYLISFLGTTIIDHMNKKLFIDLQYSSVEEKLQKKKKFHVKFQMNEHLYFSKSILKSNLQKILSLDNKKTNIKTIKVSLKQEFRKYALLHLENKYLSQKIALYNQKFQIGTKQSEKKDLCEQIIECKNKLDKINLEMSRLLIEIQKLLQNKQTYHYGHFWVQLQSFQDCLRLQNLILTNKRNPFQDNITFSFQIDNTEESDLLIENIQNREIVTFLSSIDKEWNEQFWSEFRPNRHYKNLNKILQILKVIWGCVFCVLLIVMFDIVILILHKTQIFSYPTVLVILLLEIILKILINKLSQLQRHSKFSHLQLSIMLKLTIFIFINLGVILFVGTYDLGQWSLGRIISTYQLNQINQNWFLTIGTAIILTVVTQIIFCNLRVYIQVIKNVILKFLQKHLFSLLRVNRVRQRITIWLQQLKENYEKPIIDLQVCYSQILPIYMIGIVFGYLFPVLYLLLFIFSITVHLTHQGYVEYQTGRFLYNGMLLNDWAFKFVYVSFIGGLAVVGYFQEKNRIFVFLQLGIFCLVLIAKYFFSDLNKMIIQKLQTLSAQQVQSAQQNHSKRVQNQLVQSQKDTKNSQRTLVPTQSTQQKRQQPQIKQTKNFYIKNQLKQKQIQLTLLELFGSQYQNVNQIHCYYYQKYKEIIQSQVLFLKQGQKKFSQCK